MIGLGQMGLAMARRLIDAGETVVGFDLSEAALETLGESGGRALDSIEQAAADETLILLSLPTADVCEEVSSVLARQTIRPLGVVDLSTSGVHGAQRVASILHDAGLRYAEAPVTGGVEGARQGRLTLITAGDPELLATAGEVIGHLGTVVHVGPIAGHGQAMKVLNNLLSATNLAITSEVMAAGVAFGLSPEQMLAVFNAGSGRNSATSDKFPKYVMTGAFNQGFAAELMNKDVSLAGDLLDAVGLPAFVSAAVTETWKAASRRLQPGADFTEVARLAASDLLPSAGTKHIYQE